MKVQVNQRHRASRRGRPWEATFGAKSRRYRRRSQGHLRGSPVGSFASVVAEVSDHTGVRLRNAILSHLRQRRAESRREFMRRVISGYNKSRKYGAG